jgi:hypothetical protein
VQSQTQPFSVTFICSVAYVDDRSVNERPPRGTHVDSISYYTYDLAGTNKDMYFMQRRKAEIALTGNTSFEADNWLSQLMISAYEVADQIMVDSAEDNALRATYSLSDECGSSIPQAELMSSRYGSFGRPVVGMSPRTAQCQPYAKNYVKKTLQRLERALSSDEVGTKVDTLPVGNRDGGSLVLPNTSSEEQLLVSLFDNPNKSNTKNWCSSNTHLTLI